MAKATSFNKAAILGARMNDSGRTTIDSIIACLIKGGTTPETTEI